MFTRIAIVGTGLIGGSFALALRRAGQVGEIVGFDRDPASARRAVQLGIADRAAASLASAVDGCDLVLVAAPVGQTGAILEAIATSLPHDALVTDVGSTKADAIVAARAALGDRVGAFVPGHPIAGREVHGPDAAQAGLFENKRVLITPIAENTTESVARVADAWTACGARVTTLSADAHDRVLSAVSHLPHVLAYALVAQIAGAADADLKFSLAGGGFRDFTRIAASSPEMWRDIALSNRDALLDDLDAYRALLDTLRRQIASGDAAALEALFTRARDARQQWTPDGA